MNLRPAGQWLTSAILLSLPAVLFGQALPLQLPIPVGVNEGDGGLYDCLVQAPKTTTGGITFSTNCSADRLFEDPPINASGTASVQFPSTYTPGTPLTIGASITASFTGGKGPNPPMSSVSILVLGDGGSVMCNASGPTGTTSSASLSNCTATPAMNGQKASVVVYFNASVNAVPTGPTAAAVYGSDAVSLKVDHIEVVQAVQTQTNDVSLVAGKPGVVRAFVTSPQPVTDVTGVLHVMRGKSEIATVNPFPVSGPMVLGKPKPAPPASTITSGTTFNRDDITQSLNFKLDPKWLTPGDLQFLVDVSAPNGTSPPRFDPGRVFHFAPTKGLKILWFNGCYLTLGSLLFNPADCGDHQKAASIAQAAEAFVKAAYPAAPGDIVFEELTGINQLDRTYFQGVLLPSFLDSAAFRYVLNWTDNLILAETKFDQLMVIFPESIGASIGGDSDPPYAPFFGLGRSLKITMGAELFRDGTFIGFRKGNRTGKTVAHEMGHNLGRKHTGVCDDKRPSEWPYPNGSIQQPGFNPITFELIESLHAEMMSYCDNSGPDHSTFPYSSIDGIADYLSWISPFTYGNLFTTLALPDPTAQVRAPLAETHKSDASPSGQAIIIGGWAASDGSAGQLDPAFIIPAHASIPPSVDGGSHCLHFTGPTGPLVDYCFQIPFFDQETGLTVDQQAFAVTAPYPAGTTRVSLTTGGQEIAALNASSAPPQIAISSPATGDTWMGGLPQTISWTASDADGLPVTFTVLYSSDGGTNWLPLTLNSQDSQFTFDPALIEGGPNVMFRLLASDGLNNSSVDVGPINVSQSPSIQASTPSLDFGVHALGLQVTATLTLTNSGSGPLHIGSMAADVPDFIISSGFAPMTIPAGASRDVTFTWTPVSTGLLSSTLTIASDDPVNPTLTVSLNGTGGGSATPAIATLSALNFGSVSVGRTSVMTLPISNQGAGALTLASLSGLTGPFSLVSPPQLPATVPDAGLSLKVQFAPTTTGDQSASLVIASNDSAAPNSTVTLAGTATAPTSPEISAPATVDFGSVSVGQRATLTFTVTNNGIGTLSIQALSGLAAPFSLVSPPSLPANVPASGLQLTVAFSPTVTGSQKGTLTIASNDPAVPLFTVTLTGTVAAPVISALPSVSFGSVLVGQQSTMTVTISNTGNAPLTVSNLQVAAPFSLLTPPQLPATVPASGLQLTLAFTPLSAGLQTGVLTIVSNDSATPSLKVTLTGTGTATTETISRTLVYHEITRFPKQVRFGNGGEPVLSSSGNRIVYANAPGDETDARYNDIFVVNSDGSGQRMVDSYKQNCFCGAVVDISADGNTVVSTDSNELRIATATGATGKRLINNRIIPYIRISPKGDKVFFVHARGDASATDPTTERGLYVINADGTGLKQIAGPKAVGALFGNTLDQVFPFATNGWSLDVSADGSRLVFGTLTPGGERILQVNADGTGLKQLMGPFSSVNHVALSGDGTKAAYDVTPPPCCSTPNEVGVINFDGSGRKALGTNVGGLDGSLRMQLSNDGSKLLYGGAGRLYSTDGSGLSALSVRGGYFSSDPPGLINDGLGLATMNATADRFIYSSGDDTGIQQLATMDINPAALGEAPAISTPTLTQTSIALDGANQSTISATVKTTDKVTRVSAAILNAGLNDPDVNPPVMLDDGTSGDVASGDGVYSSNRLSADCCSVVGPKTVRVKAEIRDSSNKRHATAVEFGGLTVVSKAP